MPKHIFWVSGWRLKHPYHCTLLTSKVVLGYLGWGCLNCTMPKNIFGSGVASQTPIPLYPIGQQKCFWIPGISVHNARKYSLCSGVAPPTPTPRYPIGQQRRFWIPRMGVFELRNAKRYCLGSEVAPQTPTPLYPIGQQTCFWIPRMGVFELHNAKKYCLGSGVAPEHPYHCTLLASKSVFGYLGYRCTMPENILCVQGWRPQHPHHGTP